MGCCKSATTGTFSHPRADERVMIIGGQGKRLCELVYVRESVDKSGDSSISLVASWEAATWSIMSYAERLRPSGTLSIASGQLTRGTRQPATGNRRVIFGGPRSIRRPGAGGTPGHRERLLFPHNEGGKSEISLGGASVTHSDNGKLITCMGCGPHEERLTSSIVAVASTTHLDRNVYWPAAAAGFRCHVLRHWPARGPDLSTHANLSLLSISIAMSQVI